jgi:transposase-like protein
MPIPKLSEKSAPIKIEQTTLNKFFPKFFSEKINTLITDETRRQTCPPEENYTLIMKQDGAIYIKETHCLRCGRRLVKNGHNPRIAVLDKDLGKHEFRIHRKRCSQCGEIKPNYLKIAPRFGIYHENHKRRARQHYMEGLTPSQIKRVFKIDFGIDISVSSIVNWVNKIAEPLRETLRETPVPSSGYWGYDEIHMKISGKKRYAIDTVDVNTKFVPVARIMHNMGRRAGAEVLREGRRNATLQIHGMVKDCSTNLGRLFRTRGFNKITQQNCITHVKWIVARHVKIYAGIPSRSTKTLPKEWSWLLSRFYAIIDSKNETDAYVKLEILRNIIGRLNGRRIKRLQSAFKQIEKWLPKLIAHQRNPYLPSTNNLLESFHKKYNYYRSFKKSMKTMKGAQRVLDYRVFRHNFRRFPHYICQLELKHERWTVLLRNCKRDTVLRGQGNYFRSIFRKLDKWYGNYMEVWNKCFAIIKE